MKEKEIAVTHYHQSELIQQIDEKKLEEWLDSTGLTEKLLPSEKAMFVNIAILYGLNPFKREIYCNVYGEGKWRQCSIITGYEVYLKRAERTGKLNGWGVTYEGDIKDGSLSCTVTVHRKDWEHPFSHTAFFNEVCQKKKDGTLNAFWLKQPRFMTKKVAVAQAFRLCFPDEFGGMPYTNDELGLDRIPEEKNIITETEVITDIEPNSGEPILNTEEVLDRVWEHGTEKKSKNDCRLQLGRLLDKYEKSIDTRAFEMCCKAMAGNDEREIQDKLNRLISYLEKKKIKIEE